MKKVNKIAAAIFGLKSFTFIFIEVAISEGINDRLGILQLLELAIGMLVTKTMAKSSKFIHWQALLVGAAMVVT